MSYHSVCYRYFVVFNRKLKILFYLAKIVLSNPIKVEPCNDEVEENTSDSSTLPHRDDSRKKSKKRKRDTKDKRSEQRSVRRKVEGTRNPSVRPCSVVLRPAFVWNSPEGPIQISK